MSDQGYINQQKTSTEFKTESKSVQLGTQNLVPGPKISQANSTNQGATQQLQSTVINEFTTESTRQVEKAVLDSEHDKSKIVAKYETRLSKATLASLKNTGRFLNSAIEHIFVGQVNARGKAVGYHYEGLEDSAGKVKEGTVSDENDAGVYTARIEVTGAHNTANGKFSSFFPKSMTPQQVVDAIDEAYTNSVEIRDNTLIGHSKGIQIQMYLGNDRKIATAFPIY